MSFFLTMFGFQVCFVEEYEVWGVVLFPLLMSY